LITTALSGVDITSYFVYGKIVSRPSNFFLKKIHLNQFGIFLGYQYDSDVEAIPVMFNLIGGIAVSFICKGESKWKSVMSWFLVPFELVIRVVSLYDSIHHIRYADK
jgi:hypothetical protein